MNKYNIQYFSNSNTNVNIRGAAINEALNYAIMLMSEHSKIIVHKSKNVEIHSSGCDKLQISPPLPEEYTQFMNTQRYTTKEN